MRRTVILDADGTLYDLVGGLIRSIRNHFAYVIHREDVRNRNLLMMAPPDRPEIGEHILKCLKDPKFFYNLQPFPGVAEALLPLAEYGKLVVVTARDRSMVRATQLAMARDFPGVTISGVECRKGDNKASVIRLIPDARVAFEDDTEAALEYARKGLRTFLIGPPQAPYTTLPYGRMRNLHIAGSFPEAVEKFQATRIPGVGSGIAS